MESYEYDNILNKLFVYYNKIQLVCIKSKIDYLKNIIHNEYNYYLVFSKCGEINQIRITKDDYCKLGNKIKFINNEIYYYLRDVIGLDINNLI